MLKKSEQQEYVQYVMADLSKNLKVAVLAYEGFEVVRSEVIRKFIRELSQRLEQGLASSRGWRIDSKELMEDQIRRKAALHIRNTDWSSEISVCLKTECNGPSGWWIGVDEEPPIPKPMFNLIAETLSKEMRGGLQTGICPWFHCFEGRWRVLDDWKKPEVILELGKEGGGEFGRYLCDSLIEIVGKLDKVLRPSAPAI